MADAPPFRFPRGRVLVVSINGPDGERWGSATRVMHPYFDSRPSLLGSELGWPHVQVMVGDLDQPAVAAAARMADAGTPGA